jgi:hypothetical protein
MALDCCASRREVSSVPGGSNYGNHLHQRLRHPPLVVLSLPSLLGRRSRQRHLISPKCGGIDVTSRLFCRPGFFGSNVQFLISKFCSASNLPTTRHRWQPRTPAGIVTAVIVATTWSKFTSLRRLIPSPSLIERAPLLFVILPEAKIHNHEQRKNGHICHEQYSPGLFWIVFSVNYSA